MANGWPQLPYVWTLDGVTFGAGDGRFLDAKGWHGAPGRRTNKTARVDADGDYVGSSFRAGRVIEVEGTAVHTSTADRDATIDMLENLCTSGGPRGRYTLTRSEGTRARRCSVMIDDQVTTWVKPDGLSVGFSTQLYAPDPRMFGTELHVTNPIGLDAPAPGGVLWNGPDGTSGTPWGGVPLTPNSGFESGVGTYSGTNATIATSSTFVRTGTTAAKVTPTGAANPRIAGSHTAGGSAAVTAGTAYDVTAWAYSPLGYASGAAAVINWYDASGTFLVMSTATYTPLPAGIYVELRSRATAPATAAFATARVQLSGSPAATDVFYVDDAAISNPPGLVLQSGNATSGRVDVVNSGSAETPATITVTTTTGVTRPAVKLLSTGQRISYNGILNAGSTLTIDSSTGKVTVDGVVLPGALLDFDLFALQPGSNPLFFSSSSPGEAALMTVTWRDGYNGG